MRDDFAGLLEGAARRARPVVREVEDGLLGAPTPCAEYDVRALLNHLLLVVVNFQALAVRESADFSATPDYVGEGGWRTRFEEETARLVEVWSAPGALEGTSPGMGLPQRTVGGMVLGDLTVHAWDLARATGREYAPYGPGVPLLEESLGALAPTARRMKVFGEPFPLPDGASAFERVLAVTGRDPGWSPPATV